MRFLSVLSVLSFGVMGCCPGSAALAAPTLTARLEAAGRQAVVDEAARSGLQGVQAEATVQALPRTPMACDAPQIETVDAHSPARLRLALVCPGATGAAARQLVQLRATLSAEVVVLAADAPANQPLGEQALVLERRDISTVPDASSDLSQLAALSPRRPMRAGEIVRTRMLAATLLVKRGDTVAIVVRSGPVEVRNAGEALEAGREGQVLRVRNAATGRVIRARVLSEGMVEPVQVDTSSAP